VKKAMQASASPEAPSKRNLRSWALLQLTQGAFQTTLWDILRIVIGSAIFAASSQMPATGVRPPLSCTVLGPYFGTPVPCPASWGQGKAPSQLIIHYRKQSDE